MQHNGFRSWGEWGGDYRNSSHFAASMKAKSDCFQAGEQVELKGHFISTRFKNDETGFVIGTFRPDDKSYEDIVAKGTIVGYMEGVPYVLEAKVVDDKTWGIQLNVSNATREVPTDRDGAAMFLAGCGVKGVGAATARKIANALGDDALEKLRNDPDCLDSVKGVGIKVKQRLKEEIPLKLVNAEAIAFFTEHGFSQAVIRTLIARYGGNAKAVVERNPYVLTKVRGFAFTRADQIAMKLGVKLDDPNRIDAGIIATLRWCCAKDGHTLMPRESLLAVVYEKIGLDPLLSSGKVVESLERLLQNGNLIEVEQGIQLPYLYKAENQIKNAIVDASKTSRSLLKPDVVREEAAKAQASLGFDATDEQLEAVYNVFLRNVSVLTGGAGAGKALLNSTDMWCFDPKSQTMFLRSMGDLEVGDFVFDENGKPTKIIGVYPQGMCDVYKVTFDDQREILCNKEHIWRVSQSYHKNHKEPWAWKDMTVAEMLESGIYTNDPRPHRNYGSKFSVPMNKAVELPERNFSIPPYVMGTLLGDGCCTEKAFTISSSEENIIKEVAARIGAAGYRRNPNNYSWDFCATEKQIEEMKEDIGYSTRPYGKARLQTKFILRDFPQLMWEKAERKEIPNEYFFGSIEQRWELIQGLMDTDGSISGDTRYNVSFSSKSKSLINNLRQLLFSLGIGSTIKSYDRSGHIKRAAGKIYVRNGIEYTLHIKVPNSMKPMFFRNAMIKVKRAAEAAAAPLKRRKYEAAKIKAIEKLGYRAEMTCIEVDSPSHLYCAGRDFIVTHNTTSQKIIVNIAERLGIPFVLCSPTGRAAKNLSESCTQKGHAPVPAYTLHRALSIMVGDSNDKEFFADDVMQSNENAQLTEANAAFKRAKIVLCDEASMIDTQMAALLLKKSKGKHLLLIGDPNQLPSVGVGAFLNDMLMCRDVPSTRLTKIFRQAADSPVIVAAHAVLRGEDPCDTDGIEFHECMDDDVQETIRKFVLPRIKDEHLGFKDIAFMSPMKVRTKTSGTNGLNEFLRPTLNPSFKEAGEDNWKLQAGDFVTQVKNNYDVDRYNGDRGVVTKIDGEGYHVEFLDDGDSEVIYEPFEVSENLMLAYASTIHRYQGSQCPTVVLVLTDSHFVMCNRNLLYTGITRAQERVILIGNRSAFKRAAKNNKETKRMTGLIGFSVDKVGTR